MPPPLEVLIVTYAFPPRGGVAVQRVLSWVRHFPAHGIRPTVLTVTPPAGTIQYDASLLERIPPEVRVIRTSALEPYRIYRALGGQRAQDDPRQRESQVAGGDSGGVGERLYRGLQERWLVPDAKIGWYPFALEAARALRQEGYRPSVVLATQPPASACLIGSALAKLFAAPLVLDYRDPWTTGYYPLNRPTAVAERERALERRVLGEAAAVVTVSEKFQQMLAEIVKDASAFSRKSVLIENGWDEGLAENLDVVNHDSPTILHAGSLYAQRSPLPFLTAAASLREADPGLWSDWKIRLLGNVEPQYLRAAEADRLPLEYGGFVSHREALAAQHGADILLLFSEGMLTAKVYEYLQARKPILAIGDSTELDVFLREWGAGACYRPDDIGGIQEALAALMQQRNLAGGPITLTLMGDLATRERGVLAGRMATLLQQVASGQPVSAAYTPVSDA